MPHLAKSLAMNVLIFLTHPEPTRSGYEKYLTPRHPELNITTVSTRDEALKLAPEADILMAFGPQVKKDFFQHTPKLKWVFSLGTGTDGITDSPFLGKDVIVTAMRGIHGEPISEMAFLQCWRSPATSAASSASAWKSGGSVSPARCCSARPSAFSASAPSPRGSRRAARRSACACRDFPHQPADPGIRQDLIRAEIVQAMPELDHFVMLVPLEDDTRNFVNDRVLSAMKPTAFLTNLARGGVLDEDALVRALNEKKLAGAALDALATEPLPADEPALDHAERDHHAAPRRLLRQLSARRRDAVREELGIL